MKVMVAPFINTAERYIRELGEDPHDWIIITRAEGVQRLRGKTFNPDKDTFISDGRSIMHRDGWVALAAMGFPVTKWLLA